MFAEGVGCSPRVLRSRSCRSARACARTRRRGVFEDDARDGDGAIERARGGAVRGGAVRRRARGARTGRIAGAR